MHIAGPIEVEVWDEFRKYVREHNNVALWVPDNLDFGRERILFEHMKPHCPDSLTTW